MALPAFLRRKRTLRVLLLIYAAACGAWLWRLDYSRKISTSVLDLIPDDKRSPELSVVRDLADQAQARVVLFEITTPDPAAAAGAARDFAAALRREPIFASAEPVADQKAFESLGRAVFARRMALLLPTWLGDQERAFQRAGRPGGDFSAWAAERAAADLESFLARPEAMPMQRLIPSDPLLLVPRLIDQARSVGAAEGGAAAGLVWSQINASPLSEAGQGPLFEAVERVSAELRAHHPGAAVRWTGISRFAAASRARIESEIKTLNICSLIAVLLIGCAFVRRLWKLLHLAPVLLCSLLGAWCASTLVFARLHILVFAIGSLLTGVAIDYGFYIFMQPFTGPHEDYAGKLRRLLKPLLASCLTTVAGFSLLLFSDLPLIRQVGFFVSAGLLTALVAAMAYFGQLDRPLLEPRPLPDPLRSRSPRTRLGGRIAAALLVAAAVGGLFRLHWRDDVRELEVPLTALEHNDQEIRGLFGGGPGRPVYLTYGSDLPSARARLGQFEQFIRERRPAADFVSLGALFPLASDYQELPERLTRLGRFPDDLRSALTRHGFLPESFAPFFVEWDAARRAKLLPYSELCRQIGATLTGPLRLLYSPGSSGGGPAWFASIVDAPEVSPLPADLHTVAANQLQHLDALFTEYRWSALRLSLIGLGLIIASVFVIYPWRAAIRIALIPAGSCFFIYGWLGLTGHTLNLFNLLGAFLGVCLAHNYSIFSSETAALRQPPPAPVRLSGLCAAASFGVLAASSVPVVHALGLTVCLIVLTALAAVECERVLRRPLL